MNRQYHRTSQYGGSAPATPGFNALGPEWLFQRAAVAAPAIPAAESALGAHPCVALPSAPVPNSVNQSRFENVHPGRKCLRT